MKKKTAWIWLAALCVPVLLLGLLGSTAAEKSEVRFNSLRVDGNTVHYSIDSSYARTDVLAITATYNAEQMCQQQSRRLDLKAGTQTGSHTFSEEFETCKVFLLDGKTNMPLCDNAGLQQVRFLDHTGDVLLEQSVYTGGAALPPAAPERSGYLFAGWDGDYQAVLGDCDITAAYVEQNAANVFIVSCADAQAGEEVNVRVALTGTVQVCGYDMELLYDRQVLEFVGMDAELSMDVLPNHIEEEGRVKFNFGAIKNRTKAGNIMDVTFRVRDCEPRGTALKLKANSVICVDPADADRFLKVDHTVCEGVIRVL